MKDNINTLSWALICHLLLWWNHWYKIKKNPFFMKKFEFIISKLVAGSHEEDNTNTGGFHYHGFWPLYAQVGDFRDSRGSSTVLKTWILRNAVFFKSQNPRKAGTLCILFRPKFEVQKSLGTIELQTVDQATIATLQYLIKQMWLQKIYGLIVPSIYYYIPLETKKGTPDMIVWACISNREFDAQVIHELLYDTTIFS